MAAARQKEMKLKRAVVATRTRGIPLPWLPGTAGFWGVLLIYGYLDLQESMLPLFLRQVQLTGLLQVSSYPLGARPSFRLPGSARHIAISHIAGAFPLIPRDSRLHYFLQQTNRKRLVRRKRMVPFAVEYPFSSFLNFTISDASMGKKLQWSANAP